ncbi:MFS transporter [Pectobacterium carotovorum]|uniref:MFS transporter n=1 Tax=Pectobacterium carotovorum TaxID=554 RepID=UPI00381C3740
MEWLPRLWEQFQWAVAGLIGALISVPFQSDLRTARGIAIFVFTGSACAHYLTGIVGDYFNINPSSAGGIGFLLGAFGGSLIAAVIKAIEAADLWGLVRSRFGGGTQ